MSSTKLKHVIIAGGGLGGLSTALSFHYLFSRHNLIAPRITIYEREKNESSRVTEGYTLGIRGDRVGGGVQALRTINKDLYDDLRSMAAPEGEKNEFMKFGFGVNCDLNPTVTFNNPADEDSFRIARYKLRNRLVEEVKHIGESHMKMEWNSHVIKADYDKEKNKVNVELEDGRQDECDMLIGEFF
jgi:2-polyprenyl-6-methoxyphenol hydroxylase-like FAD-dependent oxidoreductase